MKDGKSGKITKRVAAGTAGAVAAASLLVNAVVTDPSALHSSDGFVQNPSHVSVVDGADPPAVYVLETDDHEPYTLRERICLRLRSWPAAVRTLILLPLWGLGELLISSATALLHSPIGQALLHFLLEAALLTALFASVWKLLFPHVPLRKLFSRKNFPWLLAGALLLAAADALLGRFWEPWKDWRVALFTAAGFAVLFLLSRRILDKLPLPERKKKTVKVVLE
ncbi:MAG: hypothetical protein IKN53_03375 [Oscillibacter sp.]|nr:hypothetical protein [Oscillibacter sp.]